MTRKKRHDIPRSAGEIANDRLVIATRLIRARQRLYAPLMEFPPPVPENQEPFVHRVFELLVERGARVQVSLEIRRERLFLFDS